MVVKKSGAKKKKINPKESLFTNIKGADINAWWVFALLMAILILLFL